MLNRRGITLLESAIALVIFGLIVAAVWVVYAKVSFNNNLGRTERGILETTVNIREYYRDRPMRNDGFNNTTAINFGLISPELISSNGSIHYLSPNGTGPLTVGASNAICGPTVDVYFLVMNNLSREGCNGIIVRLLGNRSKIADYNVFSASVNGVNPLSAESDLDVRSVINSCVDNNTVVLCFRTK
ncbi:MAG TPA: prepilin-type N-terminal cleavage/methylation domain-containing protein [Alphaproteobacteria bacterium]|nr:prepilin-type N-terminal cleavage/methylation domain-containing protein [Alphaproteobacteria bacterium]